MLGQLCAALRLWRSPASAKLAETGLRDSSLRQHDDFRANLYAIEEIDHVVIGEPNTAARDVLAGDRSVLGGWHAAGPR